MSEVKPLNLSGGYNPLAEVDRESYADKVRKNSQTIMQQAMGKYQMQAAQQNMQNQKTMQRADMYFGENYNKFTTSKANIKDPKSWSFNSGDTRAAAFNDYKDKVGGNYAAFNEAWTSKQGAEQKSLLRGLQDWQASIDDEEDYKKEFSVWYDDLSETAQNNLKGNASQELYTLIANSYLSEDKRRSTFDKFVDGAVTWGSRGAVAAGGAYSGLSLYRGAKGVKNFFTGGGSGGSEEILKEAKSKVNSTGTNTTGPETTTQKSGGLKVKEGGKLNLRKIMFGNEKVGGTSEKNFIKTVKERFSSAMNGKNKKGFMSRLMKLTNANPKVKKQLLLSAGKIVGKKAAQVGAASAATGPAAPLTGTVLSVLMSALTVKELYDLYNDPEIQKMIDG
tara:strand:- start:536 stop:1711 length:1176 start_codon:yes stop_codon:yes gene_type:complete